MRRNTHHSTKIHQALELLNEAAHEKRDELFTALEHRYDDLRSIIGEVTGTVKEKAKNAQKKTTKVLKTGEERLEEFVTQTAGSVDQKVHDHPWMFMSGVALGGFLMGYRKGAKHQNGKHGNAPSESL